jgi:hypothetical protein
VEDVTDLFQSMSLGERAVAAVSASTLTGEMLYYVEEVDDLNEYDLGLKKMEARALFNRIQGYKKDPVAAYRDIATFRSKVTK